MSPVQGTNTTIAESESFTNARLEAVNEASTARHEQVLMAVNSLEKRLDALVADLQYERDYAMHQLDERFAAKDKAVALATDVQTAKLASATEAVQRELVISSTRFLALEAKAALVEEHFARLQMVEKAATLSESNINIRFAHVGDDLTNLRESIDTRFGNATKGLDNLFTTAAHNASAVNETLNVRFQAAEKASDLAAASIEKRFESVNEFRGQLKDQAALFIVRSEVDVRFAAANHDREALSERINSVEKVIANYEGRLWAISVGITILSILVNLGLHFLK